MVAESPGSAPTMIPRALPPKMRAIILKVKTACKAAKSDIKLILSLPAGGNGPPPSEPPWAQRKRHPEQAGEKVIHEKNEHARTQNIQNKVFFPEKKLCRKHEKSSHNNKSQSGEKIKVCTHQENKKDCPHHCSLLRTVGKDLRGRPPHSLDKNYRSEYQKDPPEKIREKFRGKGAKLFRRSGKL
jgi:hypothetical protein